jgi:hypothetical protein
MVSFSACDLVRAGSESLGDGSVGRGRVVIWGVGLARCYVTLGMYFVTVEWGEG